MCFDVARNRFLNVASLLKHNVYITEKVCELLNGTHQLNECPYCGEREISSKRLDSKLFIFFSEFFWMCFKISLKETKIKICCLSASRDLNSFQEISFVQSSLDFKNFSERRTRESPKLSPL